MKKIRTLALIAAVLAVITALSACQLFGGSSALPFNGFFGDSKAAAVIEQALAKGSVSLSLDIDESNRFEITEYAEEDSAMRALLFDLEFDETSLSGSMFTDGKYLIYDIPDMDVSAKIAIAALQEYQYSLYEDQDVDPDDKGDAEEFPLDFKDLTLIQGEEEFEKANKAFEKKLSDLAEIETSKETVMAGNVEVKKAEKTVISFDKKTVADIIVAAIECYTTAFEDKVAKADELKKFLNDSMSKENASLDVVFTTWKNSDDAVIKHLVEIEAKDDTSDMNIIYKGDYGAEPSFFTPAEMELTLKEDGDTVCDIDIATKCSESETSLLWGLEINVEAEDEKIELCDIDFEYDKADGDLVLDGAVFGASVSANGKLEVSDTLAAYSFGDIEVAGNELEGAELKLTFRTTDEMPESPQDVKEYGAEDFMSLLEEAIGEMMGSGDYVGEYEYTDQDYLELLELYAESYKDDGGKIIGYVVTVDSDMTATGVYIVEDINGKTSTENIIDEFGEHTFTQLECDEPYMICDDTMAVVLTKV